MFDHYMRGRPAAFRVPPAPGPEGRGRAARETPQRSLDSRRL